MKYNYYSYFISAALIFCFFIERFSRIISFLCLILAFLVFPLLRVPQRAKIKHNSIVSPVSGIVFSISEEENWYFIDIATYPLVHCQVMALLADGATLDTANNSVIYKNNITVKHYPTIPLHSNFCIDNGIYCIAIFGFRTIVKIPKQFTLEIVPGQKLIDRETPIAINVKGNRE